MELPESMADMTPESGGAMKADPAGEEQISDPVEDQGLQSTASEGTADPSGQPGNAAEGEGVQSGDSAAASPDDDTPPPVLPSHLKPEDAYQFGQYHQRRADKIAQEFQEFKQQASDVEQLRPLLNAITTDPELYQQVQKKFSPQAQQQAQQQAPAPDLNLEALDVPEGVFDEDQAGVVKGMMGQFKGVIEQLATQNQQLMQKLTGFEQATQQTQAQSQRQQAMQDLMFNYNLSAPEAEAFMKDMVDERRYLQDPSMLVNAWRASQRPTADQVRAQHNVQKSQQQQQSRTPSMSASGGAATPAPATNGLFVEKEGESDPFEPIR